MKQTLYMLVLLTFVCFKSDKSKATLVEDVQQDRNIVSNRSPLEKQIACLGDLPAHLLEDILYYAGDPHFRKVNKQFYNIVTGEEAGQASIGMKECLKPRKINIPYKIEYIFPDKLRIQ